MAPDRWLESPGERRVYRLGHSLFRVWIDAPNMAADILLEGSWAPTPIPSGVISTDPQAEDVPPEEQERLGLPP